MEFESDRAAESGQLRAARSRARADQLRAEAERMDAFADAVEKGNQGERLTATRLDILDGSGWRVLNDRRKSASSPANIDHIVVGPSGVFVIDSKHWSSRVQLDDRGLFASGHSKTRELEGIRQAAMAVQMHLTGQLSSVRVTPVLCFTRPVGLNAPTTGAGVVAVELEHLLPWLTALPRVLNEQDVRRIGSSLDAAFGHRAAPAVRHPSPPPPPRARPRPAPRQLQRPRRPAVSDGDKVRIAIGVLIALLLVTGVYAPVSSWLVHQLVDRTVPSPTPSGAPVDPVRAPAP